MLALCGLSCAGSIVHLWLWSLFAISRKLFYNGNCFVNSSFYFEASTAFNLLYRNLNTDISGVRLQKNGVGLLKLRDSVCVCKT